MREVERHDRHRDAAGEHGGRRLRVDVGVELGRRRDVAEGDRAAHPDDLARLRAAGEGGRDVGQRPGGDEDRVRRQLVEDQPDGTARVDGHDRFGQLGAVQARRAVDVGCDDQLADERPVGALRDGHVVAACQRQHAARVLGGAGQRLVAGDRRQRDEVDGRAGERQQDRDGVVVPRVAVEDDARHAYSPPSTRSQLPPSTPATSSAPQPRAASASPILRWSAIVSSSSGVSSDPKPPS